MDLRLDHPLFDRVRTLELPADTWVIFGSGPMIARGIIPLENDLDIMCLPVTWDWARQFGPLDYLETEGVYVISIEDSAITLGTGWAYGDVDVPDLIARADTIDGLPFAPLDAVVTYKKIAARPKDALHLKLIEEYLAAGHL
jgi:hypothetical protein